MSDLVEIILTILLGVAILWCLQERNRHYAAKKLSTYSQTQGVVIDKWITGGLADTPGPAAYCLKYEFRNHRGEKITHSVKMSVPLEDWDTLESGSKIQISYSDRALESYPVSYLRYGEKNKIEFSPGLIGFVLLVWAIIWSVKYWLYGDINHPFLH